jgi:D-aminopeptidase
MTADIATRLDRLAARLPVAYPGPGGAIAVLRHAWGYANAERRIPFTPRSLFRVCSITK